MLKGSVRIRDRCSKSEVYEKLCVDCGCGEGEVGAGRALYRQWRRGRRAKRGAGSFYARYSRFIVREIIVKVKIFFIASSLW
jgi:hypothetical protein